MGMDGDTWGRHTGDTESIVRSIGEFAADRVREFVREVFAQLCMGKKEVSPNALALYRKYGGVIPKKP